jgi:hypothetical protein
MASYRPEYARLPARKLVTLRDRCPTTAPRPLPPARTSAVMRAGRRRLQIAELRHARPLITGNPPRRAGPCLTSRSGADTRAQGRESFAELVEGMPKARSGPNGPDAPPAGTASAVTAGCRRCGTTNLRSPQPGSGPLPDASITTWTAACSTSPTRPILVGRKMKVELARSGSVPGHSTVPDHAHDGGMSEVPGRGRLLFERRRYRPTWRSLT